MAKRTSKSLKASQIIFKEQWRYYNSGGQWLEYVEDRRGEDLLVQAKLEDIVPGETYYFRQVYKPNHFHPTVFDPSVQWESVKELVNTGNIWRLK